MATEECKGDRQGLVSKAFFMPLMRTLLGWCCLPRKHVSDLLGQVERDLRADGSALLWVLGTS